MNNTLQDYIVLDLETPNRRANSVCSIGIVIVKDNKIIDKKYSLIDPEDSFDNQNINIHGINRSDVINSPTIAEYWSEIKKLFSNNIIVGHNIIFDLTVLAKALSKYDIKFPEVKYICTLNEIQKCLDLSSYKLPNICKHIGSELCYTHFAIVLNKNDSIYSDNVTVIPITSKRGNNRIALGKILHNVYPNSLKYNLNCYANVTQIKSISKARIFQNNKNYVCNNDILDKIDDAILTTFTNVNKNKTKIGV